MCVCVRRYDCTYTMPGVSWLASSLCSTSNRKTALLSNDGKHTGGDDDDDDDDYDCKRNTLQETRNMHMPHKVCLQEATVIIQTNENHVSAHNEAFQSLLSSICATEPPKAKLLPQLTSHWSSSFSVYVHTENLGPFPVIKVCHKSGRCSPWRLDFKSASSFIQFHSMDVASN